MPNSLVAIGEPTPPHFLYFCIDEVLYLAHYKGMTHAIAVLQIALEVARFNETTLRSVGQIEEADQAREKIDSLLRAIHNLKDIENQLFSKPCGYPAEPVASEGTVAQENCPTHTSTLHEVPVTPEYRLLEFGEELQEGDEVRRGQGSWYDLSSLFFGDKVSLVGSFRRRITP